MPLKSAVQNRFQGKWIFIVSCACLVFFATCKLSQASWYIDEQRFLSSVHGEVSCQDCHKGIAEKENHPNPSHVQKDIPEFFSPDMCYECHDGVSADIGAGIHGKSDAKDLDDPENCIVCHDYHYEGAPETPTGTNLSVDAIDADCMNCHRQVNRTDPERVSKIRSLCFTCHNSPNSPASEAAQIDPANYQKTPHTHIDCLACHPEGAGYRHDQQAVADCLSCHHRHPESIAHDAHIGVACQACHLMDVDPVRSGWQVGWSQASKAGRATRIHDYMQLDESSCARCHFAGTTLGASAMILPAKSIACMPCHAATLTVGDGVTLIALLIFLCGIIGLAAIWVSTSRPAFSSGGIFSPAVHSGAATLRALKNAPMVAVAKAIFLDVFLQRRLFRQSFRRWLIHALIFFPIAIRFVWGIAALLATNGLKGFSAVWILIDKNYPVTALFFDLTGIMMIIGVIWAWLRGRKAAKQRPVGLPGQDGLALVLIGAIVVVGFFLEGMRIALAGSPPHANFAFAGFLISRLFVEIKELAEVYGIVWYAHAILTGAFIAYLPFSRLMHMILAPVALAMNAVARYQGHTPDKGMTKP